MRCPLRTTLRTIFTAALGSNSRRYAAQRRTALPGISSAAARVHRARRQTPANAKKPYRRHRPATKNATNINNRAKQRGVVIYGGERAGTRVGSVAGEQRAAQNRRSSRKSRRNRYCWRLLGDSKCRSRSEQQGISVNQPSRAAPAPLQRRKPPQAVNRSLRQNRRPQAAARQWSIHPRTVTATSKRRYAQRSMG